MIRIFGDFIERKDDDSEYLKIGFSPTSIPIQQRWRNNGLSADFLADYLSTFFPGDDRAVAECQAEFKSAVSYIANELLENAMKFSYAPAIPAEPSSPVITVLAALAFRKHRCENTP